jgi:hypothetical protein
MATFPTNRLLACCDNAKVSLGKQVAYVGKVCSKTHEGFWRRPIRHDCTTFGAQSSGPRAGFGIALQCATTIAQSRIAKLIGESRLQDLDIYIQIANAPKLALVRELTSVAIDIGFSRLPANDPRLRFFSLWNDALPAMMCPDNALQRKLRALDNERFSR